MINNLVGLLSKEGWQGLSGAYPCRPTIVPFDENPYCKG
jgi:hypothetical protein